MLSVLGRIWFKSVARKITHLHQSFIVLQKRFNIWCDECQKSFYGRQCYFFFQKSFRLNEACPIPKGVCDGCFQKFPVTEKLLKSHN